MELSTYSQGYVTPSLISSLESCFLLLNPSLTTPPIQIFQSCRKRWITFNMNLICLSVFPAVILENKVDLFYFFYPKLHLLITQLKQVFPVIPTSSSYTAFPACYSILFDPLQSSFIRSALTMVFMDLLLDKSSSSLPFSQTSRGLLIIPHSSGFQTIFFWFPFDKSSSFPRSPHIVPNKV